MQAKPAVTSLEEFIALTGPLLEMEHEAEMAQARVLSNSDL